MGDKRFNVVTVGKNQKVKQRFWLPNPEAVMWGYEGKYGWMGKISPRLRWQQTVRFDPEDPFFANYTDGEARQRAMERQEEFQALLMEWAHSFLGVPYAWGGQTYGGRQSKSSGNFTCSADIDPDPKRVKWHRIDVVSQIGSSLLHCGYGIDCSGFVVEVALLSGKIVTEMNSRTLTTTTFYAKGLGDDLKYVRVGDFLSYRRPIKNKDGQVIRYRYGHVIYARARPRWEKVNKRVKLVVDCIEAYPGTYVWVPTSEEKNSWFADFGF